MYYARKENINMNNEIDNNTRVIWDAAIGLQLVDSLKTSDFLNTISEIHCAGETTFYEAELVVMSQYYLKKREEVGRTREADVLSVRIAEILLDTDYDFELSLNQYRDIHKELFAGIYNHNGKFRAYNIIKNEEILNGDTVIYGNASELERTVEYDISQEKEFIYEGLSTDETIKHLANFIAGLWQIHPFEEGNTRTTAVFILKYLESMGFSLNYKIFANHSKFFRNALVRANYSNKNKNIYTTTEYIEIFLKNLILKEDNILDNIQLNI